MDKEKNIARVNTVLKTNSIMAEISLSNKLVYPLKIIVFNLYFKNVLEFTGVFFLTVLIEFLKLNKKEN